MAQTVMGQFVPRRIKRGLAKEPSSRRCGVLCAGKGYPFALHANLKHGNGHLLMQLHGIGGGSEVIGKLAYVG